MSKYYLLLAGSQYYPSARTGNWIGTFETREEIEVKEINTNPNCKECLKDKCWPGFHTEYEINGSKYDWYEIVDLRTWIGNETI